MTADILDRKTRAGYVENFFVTQHRRGQASQRLCKCYQLGRRNTRFEIAH